MTLNPRRRGTKRLMSDPQAMHAAVMSTFPPDLAEGGDEGRVLWRLDTDGPQVFLYVVSPGQPSFEVIQEQAGWSAYPTDATRLYGNLLDRLAPGQEYAFRLTANPVHTVTDERGRKKRMGHVTVAQQEEWFLGRCAAIGIEVRSGAVPEQPWRDLVVRDRGVVQFRRGDKRVTLSRATFEGTCRVTDPDRLRHSLTHGIGRAKGYGCGLMTLASSEGAHASDPGRSAESRA